MHSRETSTRMISDYLEVEKQRENNQRKVRMRDSNPVPQTPCRNVVFFPPDRLIPHLQCDENEKKKSFALSMRHCREQQDNKLL